MNDEAGPTLGEVVSCEVSTLVISRKIRVVMGKVLTCVVSQTSKNRNSRYVLLDEENGLVIAAIYPKKSQQDATLLADRVYSFKKDCDLPEHSRPHAVKRAVDYTLFAGRQINPIKHKYEEKPE